MNWRQAYQGEILGQTCTNSRNTSIPPGVLSFQVLFVNKFNLKEDISLLLCWLVSEGLELISSRCMSEFHILSIYTCYIFVFRMLSLTKIVRPCNLKLVKTTAQSRYTQIDMLQVPYFAYSLPPPPSPFFRPDFPAGKSGRLCSPPILMRPGSRQGGWWTSCMGPLLI